MSAQFILSLDIGTGSARAALVDRRGTVVAIASRPHEQIVPRFGWSEQRPLEWWDGAVAAIAEILSKAEGGAASIAAVVACGQMHATVLLDADGRPTLDAVPLWNDKRPTAEVTAWSRQHPQDYVARTANPATAAWPAFKLQWLRQHMPAAYAAATTVLSPKDYINFRLTGVRATDWTEASASFLIDPETGTWSPGLVAELGLRADLLPPIHQPADILGGITPAAAAATGLRAGTPVLAGGADFPTSLLGSGVFQPGLASDITGTSSIVTVIGTAPIAHPELTNVAIAGGYWGAFTLLDSGGDAVRWALRAFDGGGRDYAAAAATAAEAPAGANRLFFLPYLSGERLGAAPNSRAQFFGLTASHGPADLHRAVLEGVAFASRRQLDFMHQAGQRPERFIAGSGGARSDLWMRIKASMYDAPVLIPSEAESGVLGCAILGWLAVGQLASLADGVARLVRYEQEIPPDPAWRDRYDRMAPIFNRLYRTAQDFYDDLDALDGG